VLHLVLLLQSITSSHIQLTHRPTMPKVLFVLSSFSSFQEGDKPHPTGQCWYMPSSYTTRQLSRGKTVTDFVLICFITGWYLPEVCYSPACPVYSDYWMKTKSWPISLSYPATYLTFYPVIYNRKLDGHNQCAHPYYALVDKAEIVFASPKGGKAPLYVDIHHHFKS